MTMADFIPQFAPWFDKSEALELANYMDSDGYLTEFRVTQQFEQAICDYTSSEHAIMTNSGTTALMTMLYACSIGPGDEVIVPNYTMVATPNAVRAVGASPVLVDIDVDTLSLDLEKARAAVTPGQRQSFWCWQMGGNHPPESMRLSSSVGNLNSSSWKMQLKRWEAFTEMVEQWAQSALQE